MKPTSLSLRELLELQYTVLWFRVDNIDCMFRVTADRVRSEQDLKNFVESVLRKTRLENQSSHIPDSGSWSLRRDGMTVDLTKLLAIDGAVYEIIANHTSCESAEIEAARSDGVTPWSVLVLPASSFIRVSVQLWRRWLSKKKREMKQLAREEECLVEKYVSFQHLCDLMNVREGQLHSIEVRDLEAPHSELQNISLVEVGRAIMSLYTSRTLRLTITASLW